MADIELYLLDMGAGFLEGSHRLVDYGGHALVDRENAVVARIGDFLAGDRAVSAALKSTCLRQRVGIA